MIVRSGVNRLLDRFHGRYVHGRRVQLLSERLAPQLLPGSQVLDIGSGDAFVAFLVSRLRPDVSIECMDVLARENAQLPVVMFDGRRIPRPDKSVDTVIFVDVLHHTEDPLLLLREAARVTRRFILVKDHLADGLLARPLLRLMDWVGNERHGVNLVYNYWSRSQWNAACATLGLRASVFETKLGLYPVPADWVFGHGLHFIARLDVQ